MPTILTEMFRHNLWANLRILDACESLEPAQLETAAVGTYGSIARTLLHLASAEGSYVVRATGMAPIARVEDAGPFPGLEAIHESLQASGRHLIELGAAEHDDRLITYAHGGEPSTNPLSMILTKALAHASEHRTHVSASLTQLGIAAPDLDAWFFVHPEGNPSERSRP